MVWFDQDRWKDNVADAAGQPDGDEQDHEQAGGDGYGYGIACIDEHVGRRCPGTYEHMGSMRESGARQEKGDDHAEDRGGVDDIPILDETQVYAEFLVGVMFVL